MNRNSIARKTVATTLLLVACVAPNSVHAGYVYWHEKADSGGNDAFMRKDLEGSGSAEVVYSFSGEPKGFDVDANYLYYGAGRFVKRVDLDGTNETTLVDNLPQQIRGLAVDEGEVYFIDINYFKKWDGTSVTTLANLSGNTKSIGVNSTSAFIGTDQTGSRTISRYNKSTGNLEGSFAMGSSAHLEYDGIDADETYVYGLTNQLERWNLDGTNKTVLDSTTGPVPKNKALAYVVEGGNSYLYYVEYGGTQINLIKNGGSPTLFHTAVGTNGLIKGLATYGAGSGAPEPAETFAFLGLLTACCLGFRQWRQGRVDGHAALRGASK